MPPRHATDVEGRPSRPGYGRVDMDGYDDSTYGDAFADVYDEWYGEISDIGETVSTLLELAAGRAVLELGVGTGRLAVPLAEAGAAAGVTVTGVDTSAAMLERLLNDSVTAAAAGPTRLPPGRCSATATGKAAKRDSTCCRSLWPMDSFWAAAQLVVNSTGR